MNDHRRWLGGCVALTQHDEHCARPGNRTLGPLRLCPTHHDALLDEVWLSSAMNKRNDRAAEELYVLQRDIENRVAVERAELKRLRRATARARTQLEALKWMINERRPIEAELRRRIIARDASTCTYCQQRGTDRRGPDRKPWHIDHDIPVTRGGLHEEANLRLACATCNIAKGTMTGNEFLAARAVAR